MFAPTKRYGQPPTRKRVPSRVTKPEPGEGSQRADDAFAAGVARTPGGAPAHPKRSETVPPEITERRERISRLLPMPKPRLRIRAAAETDVENRRGSHGS